MSQVRTHQFKQLALQLEDVRRRIVELWKVHNCLLEHLSHSSCAHLCSLHDRFPQELDVSLVYRSRFWLLFEGVSFLNFAMHREELDRLNGIKSAAAKFANDKAKNKKLLEDERTAIYNEVYFSFRCRPCHNVSCDGIFFLCSVESARPSCSESVFVQNVCNL